ncbi:hypothetical protein [Desulfobulbus alkaliphilus]|uniref:hypothetical protein n=1 Tax=Desulfobulbus alkaliphilus TaxID=869814 RepID=UPI00196608ED|nr:hypothetical protein [Desulfobulbus alkaliphilus]MBM9536683.1 hypothetical protein [Desulfobulbus alkaliphilus]
MLREKMKKSKEQSPDKNNKKSRKNAPTIQGKIPAKRDRSTTTSTGSQTHFDPVKIGLIILLAAVVGIATAVYLTYTDVPPPQTEAIEVEEEVVHSDLPAVIPDNGQEEQSPEP